MPSGLVSDASASFVKPRPEVRPGYTVRVHERIQEGGKERVQIFEGLVISVHKGATPADSTITVRRIASGVGVEKVFSLHSPKIDKIEVKKVARVRRAKLFFLRGRRGKAARLSERFTTAEEFAVAAAPEPEPEVVEEELVAESTEEVEGVEVAEGTETEGAEVAEEPAKEEDKKEE
ncbi:50S ribosomal protein L19 [Candidatus Peribacteria bacterium]|nr:50S ribosomal protein L19 [Candidatus Peribacteria bacterium]